MSGSGFIEGGNLLRFWVYLEDKVRAKYFGVYFVGISGGEMRENRGKSAQISDINAITASKVRVKCFGVCFGGVADIQ